VPPFPLNLAQELGHWEAYIVYALIGFAFGYVLEISGFGNSKKLAAQFYFKDMTVLKVMFTAIVVAMALIFLAASMNLLDYNLIYVNPTYLWPGIIGGLIMGVGFIVGGFCPGTSLVAAATLKLDGLMFVLGVFFGIFLFGETVGSFEDFWYSSYMGRYTIPEMLGLETGLVVLLLILMALFAFAGSEMLERIFGDRAALGIAPRWRYVAAGTLVLLAVAVMVLGQPTAEDRWNGNTSGIASAFSGADDFVAEKTALLENRAVQIHPGEVLDLIFDQKIKVVLLDVRSEADFNLFHILDARNIPLAKLDEDVIEDLRAEPSNTVFFTISPDETAATEAWKLLVASSVPNAYILEGGINNWIHTFADDDFKAEHPAIEAGGDQLKYTFTAALGARYPAASPHAEQFDLEYESKVVLQLKRGPASGGCG
jgi:hypothetical protein